jgi:hypothetical protein
MGWQGSVRVAGELPARLTIIGFITENPDNLLVRIAWNPTTIRIHRG